MKTNSKGFDFRQMADYFAMVLFWGWNLIFLAFILLGFVPQTLPMLLKSIRDGITPQIYLFYMLILISIPVAATLIGIFFLHKRAGHLFALGYVVEWPLLLILLFRYFMIRQGNPAISVLLAWLAVAELLFLWNLLDNKIETRPAFWRYLRLAGLTLLFSGTLYAAGWLAFYLPPLGAQFFQFLQGLFLNFGDIISSHPATLWYEIPLRLLSYLLLLLSIALILIMPVAAPIIAGRAWIRSLSSTQKSNGWLAAAFSAVVPLSLVLILLALSMRQPQQTAFQLLQDPPTTPQQAQSLLQREDQIRAGLLNTYLASFRYISSVGEVRHIKDMYRSSFKISSETAWRIEQAYELFLRPFLYIPIHPANPNGSENQALVSEQGEAALLYQHFFDLPISEGERQTIVDAVRSNANGSQAEVAWLAVDDREVFLNRQEVNISEHGDWADVEIHEVYENRTFTRQEVVYYFSLPESAVVTGLWLGNKPDRRSAYPFQVAPRGAAQAVYRNEVRYQTDPALIEQLGPRQYRLRAFPVEPRRWFGNQDVPDQGPALHLWMTYRTMAHNGGWPLPQLAKKFNVFWDGRSTRLVDGQPSPAAETEWLPAAVPAAGPVIALAHRADFPGGISVLARPAPALKTASLPSNLRLAVVLDRSFSMREWAGDVQQALSTLKAAAGSRLDSDVYLTASIYRGESPAKVSLASLKADQVVYYGGQNAAELLAQFEMLSAGKQYDLVLVLTDGTGYELGQSNAAVQVPDAPVWLVHLGGGFPLGYDDPTQQAFQASGGGAASTVEEALARYAISRDAPGQVDQVDGYIWETLANDSAAAVESGAGDSGFAALAARRVILAEMAKNHGSLDQLPILDQLHKLAVEQGIVTPYSSMLVLVNAGQQALLDKLSNASDRYQREVENVGQTANPFAVTGVPEPEEWLLLILSAIALAYVAWRRQVQKTSPI